MVVGVIVGVIVGICGGVILFCEMLLRSIPGNLESGFEADAVSKYVDGDNWKLNPVVFASLNVQFGPHAVDRFASSMTTKPKSGSTLMRVSVEIVTGLRP